MTPAAFDKTVVVTKLSITAPKIELLAEDGDILATASAAFYQGCDGRYLVTNWHNLSGINPVTGRPMSPTNRLPSRVRVIGRHMIELDLNAPIEFEVELRGLEDGRFVWKQHSTFGRLVDVAALKLPISVSVGIVCANLDIVTNPVTKAPGDEVFVLGYPLNIAGGLNYPIWKRASIASEPSQDLDNLPKYLIDTATRKGMSGAPVFYRSHIHLTGGNLLSVGKTAQLFYGIYSGRITEPGDDINDPIAAQIGTVWKPIAVSDVVNFGSLAQF